MIFSCIALIYVARGATINKLNILGTEIENTHPLTVPVILILLTFYHWRNFESKENSSREVADETPLKLPIFWQFLVKLNLFDLLFFNLKYRIKSSK